MAAVDQELEKLALGQAPESSRLRPALAQLPLLVGADGVMVPGCRT